MTNDSSELEGSHAQRPIKNLEQALKFGAVAIGRNEGARLKICFDSLSSASSLVYVDSGSTDGSLQMACSRGIDVVELDSSMPFTAARARNAGFARLRATRPDLKYVQFVDADCELNAAWAHHAFDFLELRHDVAAVCGLLQERFPEKSIYNWLCQKEWLGPVGEIRSCAGNVMHRVSALEAVGGYREDVVAAEEDELCVRLRAASWRIWRLDCEMALHDAAMTRFGQWWKRSVRSGYAFAQGAHLHGAAPERHFVWESRRAQLWGIWIPLLCLGLGMTLGLLGWAVVLIFPLQVMRLAARGIGPLKDRFVVALFQVIARFPEALGQLRFKRDMLLKRQPTLIEHKRL
jgi:glycosyltransferase involved in cell wall biosynthesis